MLLFNIHSVLSENFLDIRSASVLSLPGRWAAVTQMFLLIHHFHISMAALLQSSDFVPPMLLTYAAAVVLSVRTKTWMSLFSEQKALIPWVTAIVSSKFILFCFASFISMLFHLPPVVVNKFVAPQPVPLASVWISMSGFALWIGLNCESKFSIHHRISLVLSLDRYIGLSKCPLCSDKAWILSLSRAL